MHFAAVPVSMGLRRARMKPHEGAGGATSKSPQPASGSIILEKPPDGYYHITYLKNVNEGEDGDGWPASSEPYRSNVQFFQWLPGDRVTGQGNLNRFETSISHASCFWMSQMQVGEHLVAVENGNFWPSSNSPRFPKRLIVEARVVWLTSSAVHVHLPEVNVVLDQKRIRLPAMAQKLNRRVRQHRGPANHRSDESSEWLRQPFYPQVNGNWRTANLADYYPPDIW